MTEFEREAANLQERFGQPGAVAFEASPLGGVVAILTAGGGTVSVALQGGQVLSWIPGPGEPDVLWCSPLSRLGSGKPVRGGIPLCWPWFGPHPDAAASLPAHGFVRAAPWQVIGVTVEGDAPLNGRVSLSLRTALAPAQHAVLGCEAGVEMCVTLDAGLEVALITTNAGPADLILSEALHTYFGVGDIADVHISGLDGLTYRDQLIGTDGFSVKY